MAKTKLVIGNKNYSSWSLRPWILLKVANIEFEEEVIPLDTKETKGKILSHSLSGRVPVLFTDGMVIWDSLAISEYIAEAFPAHNLLPKDTKKRAHMRSVCAEMHSGFASMRGELPMDIRSSSTISPSKATQADIDRIVQIWEDCLNQYNGKFLFGDNFSMADAFFAPVVTRFKSYNIKTTPKCEVYMENILNLPAMREWCESAKQEEWVIEKP